MYVLTFDALWHGRIGPGFLNALDNRRFLTAGKVPTLYLSNHDQSHVAWRAGARDNLSRMRLDHPALRSQHMYPHEWEEWQTRFNPVGVGVGVERQLVIYHRWATVATGVVTSSSRSTSPAQTISAPFPFGGAGRICSAASTVRPLRE
jgi:hypothetical protein